MKSLFALACICTAVAADGSSTIASSTPANTDVPQSGTPAPSDESVQTGCTALHFVYARGTAEPATPYGVALGDPLFNATKQLVPDLSGYGVRVCESGNNINHSAIATYTSP